MKRVILTIALILTTITVCIANDALQTIKKTFMDTMPFYQNMYNCNPYQYKDWAGLVNRVYGMENNTCHIQRGSQHCYYPSEIIKSMQQAWFLCIKEKLQL